MMWVAVTPTGTNDLTNVNCAEDSIKTAFLPYVPEFKWHQDAANTYYPYTNCVTQSLINR